MISTADYNTFGAPMVGRTFSSTSYRYGFNGKEKQDELHGNSGDAYDFGARMYDARLGRWLSIDPLFSKFPAYSPYVYVVNMPIRCIDPDGNDVIVLNAPEAAGGFGHIAVLIGNDKDGWHLYSKNGTYGSVSGSASSGESNKHPDNDVYFATLGDFANSDQNFDAETGKQEYTGAYRITTTADVDNNMKEAASKQVNTWYDVTGVTSGSCNDVVLDALKAGGLVTGQEKIIGTASTEVIMQDSKLPNDTYSNVQNHNKGTDVSALIKPSDEKAKIKKEVAAANQKVKVEAENKRLEKIRMGKGGTKINNR